MILELTGEFIYEHKLVDPATRSYLGERDIGRIVDYLDEADCQMAFDNRRFRAWEKYANLRDAYKAVFNTNPDCKDEDLPDLASDFYNCDKLSGFIPPEKDGDSVLLCRDWGVTL